MALYKSPADFHSTFIKLRVLQCRVSDSHFRSYVWESCFTTIHVTKSLHQQATAMCWACLPRKNSASRDTAGGGYRMHTVPPAVLHCTNCTSQLHLTPHTSHLPPRDYHRTEWGKLRNIVFFSTWTDKPYCKETTTTKNTAKHTTPLSLPPKREQQPVNSMGPFNSICLTGFLITFEIDSDLT